MQNETPAVNLEVTLASLKEMRERIKQETAILQQLHEALAKIVDAK